MGGEMNRRRRGNHLQEMTASSLSPMHFPLVPYLPLRPHASPCVQAMEDDASCVALIRVRHVIVIIRYYHIRTHHQAIILSCVALIRVRHTCPLWAPCCDVCLASGGRDLNGC